MSSLEQLYAAVPLHRKNGTCSAALLLSFALAAADAVLGKGFGASGLLGAITGVLLLGVCVVVLTGDVYVPKLDRDGKLERWGFANKIVAAFLVAFWIYSIVRRF